MASFNLILESLVIGRRNTFRLSSPSPLTCFNLILESLVIGRTRPRLQAIQQHLVSISFLRVLLLVGDLPLALEMGDL